MCKLRWMVVASVVLAFAVPSSVAASECTLNRERTNCVGSCAADKPNCRIAALVETAEGWRVKSCGCLPDQSETDLCYFRWQDREEREKDKTNLLGDYRCIGKCSDAKKKPAFVVQGDPGSQTATCQCMEPKK